MASTPVGVGFVGCGYIAEVHQRALNRVGGARINAVFDIDAARAASFSDATGARVTLTVEELASAPDVDVVYVCTPHADHVEPVVVATRHGKYVLCEKPLTSSREAAAEMAAGVGAAADRVVVGFNHRFMPGVRRLVAAARAMPADRRIVELSLAAPRHLETWYGLRDGGGGVFTSVGAHGLDLLAHLTGSPLNEFWAVGGNARLGPPYAEDVGIVIARLDGGTWATVTFHDSGSDRYSLDAFGLLRLRIVRDGAVLEATPTTFRAYSATEGLVADEVFPADDIVTGLGYDTLNAAVLNLITTGRVDASLATFADGQRAVEAVARAMRAARVASAGPLTGVESFR